MIDFTTTEYVFSHGREPRGRGGWAFEIPGAAGKPEEFWAPSGTYQEAKKAVIARVRELHPTHRSLVIDIKVLP